MDMNVNVTLNLDPVVLGKVEEILTGVRHLRQQGGRILATLQDLTDGMREIDTATTALAGKVEEWLRKIDEGITTEEAAPLKAEMTRVAEALRKMGSDPENPVPVPVPDPLPE